MKSLPALRLASALLAAIGTLGVAQAQTPDPRPYVETTSLTFLWNFVNTGVTKTTLPSGANPGPILDPQSYDPTEPISTDNGSPISHGAGNGDHESIMKLIVQTLTRNKGFNISEDYYIENFDYNEDGSFDNIDRDEDGFIRNVDYNRNGIIRNVDQNLDGEYLNTDINGNGAIENKDMNGDEIILNVDYNNDGEIKDSDRNGDGVIQNVDLNDDKKFADVDTNKNGSIDVEERELEIEVEAEIEIEGEIEYESYRDALLGKNSAPRDWQLVAVREVPRTVEEMATNPYTIYVTLIDRVWAGGPFVLTKFDEYEAEETPDLFFFNNLFSPFGKTINTGLTFTLGQWAASGTVREKYTGPYVTNASGKVTTAFKMKMGALFYDDPRYLAANNATPIQYHLKRHLWNLFASGHIIYNIRSIPGPIGTNLNGTFYATNVDMTGTGWFEHDFIEGVGKEEPKGNFFISEIKDNFYTNAGLAPLRVKMGNIQYQNRNMFPGFGEDTALPPPAPVSVP